ncbi:hypothetical protein, partial [Moritella sp.]|uniref:hypothetical protein n=1 Tax=Moritella sp. TaxID=78556 RepID=UPI0025FD5ABD
FGHYISASAHTDCLNKLLKSVDLDVLRRSQAAYTTATNFEVKNIFELSFKKFKAKHSNPLNTFT